MNTLKFAKKLAIPLFVALAYVPSQGLAASILGADLDSFTVFGTTGVSSAPAAPSSFIGGGGDVGTVTADAITGGAGAYNLSPGSEFQLITPVALRARDDLGPVPGTLGVGSLPGISTAIGTLGTSTVSAGVQSLDGSYTPGTYNFGEGVLTTALTLNGLGNANAVWIFRFATTLTTAEGSDVFVTNVGSGPSAGAGVGIYWNVGSAATLNGDTFAGNVLAQTAITSNGGLLMECGRLLAGTAVTLIGDSISTGCAGGVGLGSNGFDQGGVTSAIPEPETYAMLLSGLGLMGFVARRRQRNLAAAA